jgi:hypothetical protein
MPDKEEVQGEDEMGEGDDSEIGEGEDSEIRGGEVMSGMCCWIYVTFIGNASIEMWLFLQ